MTDREKLIAVLKWAERDTAGIICEQDDSFAVIADYLIANGVTFATDKKDGRKGHWIIRSSGRGTQTTNWAECSECHVCGSPQWKVCPVCETKMGDV